MRAYLYDNEEGGYLYPFGHGLSYTGFDIKNLRLDKDTISANGTIEASVEVTNTGNRHGVEVIQLYVHDKVSSVTRPMKELKGFQRVELAAGETKNVTITLDASQLAFYNRKMEFIVEPGEFDVMVGNSSRDGDLQKRSFWIK
jgi:beta-glucosidase